MGKASKALWKNIRTWTHHLTTWMLPGIGVKRWLGVVLLGTTLVGVGLVVLILDVYRNAPQTWWLPILSAISLRSLPRLVRAVIFGGSGVILILMGIWGLNRSLMKPFVRPGRGVTEAIRQHRQKERGPHIVAIGGGHGLATLLRGLKAHTHHLTAIVTVADDGGSSGRLRRELGILPPGDIRNCLAALSNDEALLAQLFQYRFATQDSGLDGHSFGNLFITALSDITGSFEEAVAESARVLAVRGRVLPSTLNEVRLVADVLLPGANAEIRVQGESQIPAVSGRLKRVWLEPEGVPAFPQAIQAILAADVIVIGPGSLYTSILPNLLVKDIAEAIRASRALKLYICNLATETGETDHFSCGDHIRAIEEHIGSGLFDIAVVNCAFNHPLPVKIDWVKMEADVEEDYAVYTSDLVDPIHPWRHDSEKLAQVIMDLYQERTGPLVE